MAGKNVKQFNTQIERLGNMADGVKTHAAEPNFPPALNEANIRKDRTDLEESREVYEKAENEARLKYDAYEAKLKEIQNKHANYSSQLYGFYGKKNQILADFGLAPYKQGGKKGPRMPAQQ